MLQQHTIKLQMTYKSLHHLTAGDNPGRLLVRVKTLLSAVT